MNAVKDYKEAIICPYCFETFSHKDVHFRMESYFDENNLNDEGYQEEDFATLPDGAEKDRLLAQTKERKPFLIRDDPRYTEWWKQYGETTERPYGIDKKLLYPVFQLPVLNPNDPKDQESLEILHPEREGVDKYLELDGDKMAISVKDRYGESTQRRVCPFCHNPLPAHYGKNRVRFISVIGITGSGKTVYLSQLLNQLPDAVSKLKLSAYATSNIDDFIANNPVMEGKPLPPASVEGRFSQPMVYDISKNLSLEQKQTNTIVLYDIAGEDCQSANAMQKYGKFVQHSDGIILLVDPSQINVRSEYTFTERSITIAPQLVLQTIHNVFLNLPSAEKCKTPMAVCVSKSDSFWDDLGDADGNIEVKEVVARDITPVLDEKTGQVLPNFNATEYNKIHNEIKKLTNGPLLTALQVDFANYNFFTFSATGGPVVIREDEEGIAYKYLKGPPIPKRISEPLLWLFYKFGYITPNEPILLPEPRTWEKRYRVKTRTGLFKSGLVIKRESEMTEQDWKNSPVEVKPSEEELERLRYDVN